MHDESIRLCACGCGQPAPIAKQTQKRFGWIKGQPVRFVLGHTARVPGHHVGLPQNSKGYEHRPLTDRFWEKVNKNGPIPPHAPELGACWLWTGHRHPTHDHGRMYVTRERGSTYAHRISWEIHSGAIPEGMDVCHRCDNPPCVNPAHLFLGDHLANMRDKVAKGRQQRGERVGSARLTADAIRAIRAEAALGVRPARAIAAMHGVSPSTVTQIIRRQTWAHVPD